MASITLKNLYKIYPGGVTAVSDFNFEIQDKEFIILVGPSGCGKSTTLRMIAGLEEITKGQIYIDDVCVNDVAPKDRDIAMVFQNYALYPHMTVFENMSFGLRLRRLPREEIRKRVEEAARLLEIDHLLERKPAALSGGQRQRVALGRAIVRNPKVFLLDEPLSNLDAKLRTTMRAVISKLHKRLETTFIYVTHDQTEAMTMGTRIVVMKDGFVQQIAPPQELYEKPCNLFVATFIGMPQMNTIEAQLIEDNNTFFVRLRSGTHQVSLPIPANKVAEDMKKQVGEKILFGIRPSDIHIDAVFLEQHPETQFTCQVDFTELLGAERNLFLKFGALPLTAVVDGKIEVGEKQTVNVCIDMERCHIFDIETQKNISIQ